MTRAERIKKYILSHKPEVCLERGRIYTEECFRDPSIPLVIRRANAFKRFLEEMTLYIGEDDLLLGNTAFRPLAASLFPEYAVDWIEQELDTFEKRESQRFVVPAEAKEEILKMCKVWDKHTHFDRVDYHLKSTIGEFLMGPGEDGSGHQHPSINQTMSIEHNQNGDGHIIPDYVGLLDTGFNPVIAKTKRTMELLDETDPEYFEKKEFLESVIISFEGAIAYAARLADLAEDKIKNETLTVERKKELQRAADALRKIPAEAPETFFEALQMVLVIHLLIQIESNGHSISMGRMDSYLYPFYKKDLDAGLITDDEVRELYECFLLKCFEANKLRDWGTTEVLGGNQLFQTVTLGGQLPNGKTAVNKLSYLFLEALGHTNMNIPTVVVSMGKSTPLEFYEAALRALLQHGGGMPAFFCDDVAVDMMLRAGVDLVDARNWAGMGCSEVRVPGKHGTGVTPVYINVFKLLELAIHNGKNPNTGKTMCPSSRKFEECRDINDVIAMFSEQLDYYLPFIPKIERTIAESYYTLTPTPFLSGTVNYRIEMAKDISWGRGPNYNDTIVHAHGYPNTANALAALDQVVFKDKKYTLEQVKAAMEEDFASEEGLAIRKAFLAAPKFGNDNDEVDTICRELFKIIPEKMTQFKPLRGGQFGCTAQTVVMNVKDGEVIGAMPDGKHAREYLADNLSPTPGTDLEGITAVFNSLAKLDHSLMDNGDILNIRFHPTALNSPEKIRKVAQAIKVYFQMGGFQVQFNVVGRDILLDAQQNPDDYRSLVVKVAGFSSFYVELEKKWQDHLIARTEYESFS